MIELTFNCFFSIQSALSTNTNSPIRKLLVLTSQLSSGCLIYFVLTAKETNMQVRNKAIRNLYKMKRSTLRKILHKSRFRVRSRQPCGKSFY